MFCSEEEIDPSIFYPIAACPYLLFPGETKPITKLLAQELPLKLDLVYEMEAENPVAGGPVLKHTLRIPYSELSKIEGVGERTAYKFLMNYLPKHMQQS